ncbi:hypothetical protein B7P33_07855 [Sediminicola luteus]|uniref:Uncharacterized protein n=1 Tax=Sediminicola luteus TaxID=319238 RepID=A0A2A4G5H0_9FLAO|nr:hypothetical protein B7P33_07855 [Sediminicola luteus]
MFKPRSIHLARVHKDGKEVLRGMQMKPLTMLRIHQLLMELCVVEVLRKPSLALIRLMGASIIHLLFWWM